MTDFFTDWGVVVALACAGAAVVYGAATTSWLLRRSPGNDQMQEISAAVQEGAAAYLNRQYTIIGIVAVVLAINFAPVPGKGALGKVLSINFDRPHPLFHGDTSEEDAGWERARAAGRVFVVLPLPGGFKTLEHMDRYTGPEDEFELQFERRWEGFEDVFVGEYALRAR